jgi:HK97 family phage portal protein
MTILAAFSDALASVDRALATRRGGFLGNFAGNPAPPLAMPVPMNQPVRLSGQDRLITYADSVATYPTIFAVWSKLVRNLSTTDIGVFRDEGEGKLTRVWDTSLEKLLREPAPGKGLIDLLQWWFNPYFVEGNGLVAKFRADGPGTLPTNLIPLDWRYMSALAVPGGPVETWISHQIGDAREIDPSEVVHLAWHSPSGSVIGTSPLQSLGVAIKLDDAAGRYQNASLANAARPSGALVIPAEAKTPDERKEMREQVEAMHKGVDNAFRLAVLFGGLSFQKLSFSAAEAELDSTRQRSQEEVCIAYDVRRSVIAENAAGSTQTLEDILRDFHRSLIPHTGLIAQVIQRQLIDPEPEWADEKLCVRLDLSELLKGTYREESDIASHLFVNGITARDESRARIGLPPTGEPEDTKPLVPHAQLQPGATPPGRDGRTLPPSTEDTARPDANRLT